MSLFGQQADPGSWTAWERKPEAPDLSAFASQTWKDTLNVSNLDAHIVNYRDAFDAVNERIKGATGEVLDNPMSADQGPLAAFQALPAFSRQALSELSPVKAWSARIDELRQKYPDAIDWDQVADEPHRAAWDKMRAIREQTNEMSRAAGLVEGSDVPLIGSIPYVGPALGSIPAFLYNAARHPLYTGAELGASFAGQMTSPLDATVNLLSFGAGGAAKSIVKNAALNASVNAVGQGILSAPKQLSYRDAGLPWGFEQWANEVAGAAGAGFAIDAAIRGPSRAILRRYGRDVAPGELFSRNTERAGFFTDLPEDLNLPSAPKARPEIDPELIRRAQADEPAAIIELAEKTGAIEDPAIRGMVDHLKLGGAVDEAAAKFFRDNKIDTGEGMRTLADAMTGRYDYLRQPEPVRQAETPFLRNEARDFIMQHAGDLETLMQRAAPQLERIDQRLAQYIDTAIENGFADVLPIVRKAVTDIAEGRSETKALKSFVKSIVAHADEMGLDRLAALDTLHSGRADPLQVAAVMKRFPDLVDTNLPLDNDFMRTARALSALDDDAFSMVGQLPPAVSAAVANLVPPGQHMRVMEDLRKAGITNPAEARAAIPALLTRPQPDMPLHGGSKIDDPSGPEAKAQTERLMQDHVEAVKEAEAPIKEREKLEQQREDLRGEIAKLDEKAANGLEFADPETNAPLSREEVDSIVDMWRYVDEMRRAKKPETLTQWLIRTGRVQDQNGELTNILGGKARHLISGKGRSLDDAALAAWEAGYFSGPDRPTVRDFLDALDDDNRGNRRTRSIDQAAEDDLAVAREMEVELEKLGIAKAKSEEDIRAHFTPEGGSRQDGGQTSAGRTGESLSDIERQSLDDSFMAALSDLDMSPEARKQRAEAMGFDTSRVLYHGTGSDINAFSLRRTQDREGRQRGLGLGKGKVYLTGAAESASQWAMQAPDRGLGSKPNVVPVYVRGPLIDEAQWQAKFEELSGGKKPYASGMSMTERDAIIAQTDAWAKEQGYKGIQQVYRDYKTNAVREVGQVAVFDPRDIRSVNAAFDPREAGSPRLMAALSDSDISKRAKLYEQLHETEARLARLKPYIEQRPMTLAEHILARAEIQRSRDVQRALIEALAFGYRITPGGVDIRIKPDAEMIYRGGDGQRYLLDATSDIKTGAIAIAEHVLDPGARMGHEAVHTLVTLGHLSPDEVALLAKAARESNVKFDEAKYREAYKDRAGLEQQILEELAAHYVEARIKPREPQVQTIMDRINALIERIRNALNGYGFKTAEDVRDAILRGDVARREAVQEWMRGQDITAMAVKPMAAMGDLDMSLEARKARAEQMGFDTNNVLYHGTKHPGFDEFKFGPEFSKGGSKEFWRSIGVFVTPSREYAREYGSNVGAYYIRDPKPYVFKRTGSLDASDKMRARDELKLAQENGYSSFHDLREFGPEIIVFNPSNIRSVNAAFDPRQSDSPNLMFAFAGEGSRNYVVFDDSLIEIVAKDGKPIEKAERQSVIDGMTKQKDGGDKMFAINDNEPRPPLHADMAAVNRLENLKMLAEACAA